MLIVVVAGMSWLVWDNTYLLYATPETESVFLKNYTPQHVIERFQKGESSPFQGPGRGAIAGKHFVTHQTEFDSTFAMRYDESIPLMTALNDDLAEQLTRSGAYVLIRGGDPHSGFHCDYRLGRSVGTVTISPVVFDSRVHRGTPLPEYSVAVVAKVELNEKWYPSEQSALQAGLNKSTP
jgi:hypothetical protein